MLYFDWNVSVICYRRVWVGSSACCRWQAEFAEALALKPDSLFVSQMFSIIDRDGNGFISFRELLYAVLLFAQGQLNYQAASLQ